MCGAPISGASRGTNVRRRRLHPRTFLAHVMPLPSMEIQLKLRELVEASARVAEAQDQVGANLAALRPSLINEFFKVTRHVSLDDPRR